MNSLKIAAAYLDRSMLLSADGSIATVEEEINNATSFEELRAVAKRVKPISLGNCEVVRLHQDNPTEAIAAEHFLKSLRDELLPNSKTLIFCKIETGGFTGWVPELNMLGEEAYPLLHVTLKIKDKPPVSVYLNPGKRLGASKVSTQRYLEKRGVLQKVRQYGVDASRGEVTLVDYLEKHGVSPNDPANDNQVLMVCVNPTFYKAFINKQLPNLAQFFSPKSVDLTGVNNLLEARGRYNEMCYARYIDDPVKHVEALEAWCW